MSVECQCPDCEIKRARKAALSGMWGIGITIQPPEPEPDIAPLPIDWVTNLKPLTDTVAERAAFLLKQGLTCPTVIDDDDVNAIGNAMGLM